MVVATVGLIVRRPRWLDEGWVAAAGAAVMLAFGWGTIGDVERAVVETAPILLFLLGMMVIAASADAAGIFEWAARLAIQSAGGSGWRLFVNLYLLGAIVTLLLSLDVTAIVLAPIICVALLRLQVDPRPFLVACAFVANTGSLALPMSNLTNMLVYELLGVGMTTFVRHLALPHLVALLVNLGIFRLLFRGAIPSRVTTALPDIPYPDRPFFLYALAVVGIVIVGLLVLGLLGSPLWPPALLGAVLLVGPGLARRRLAIRSLAAGVSWSLTLFVVGLYAVVLAFQRALGVIDLSWLRAESLLAMLALVLTVTLGVNLVNNIPMSLLTISLLQQIEPAVREVLAGAVLIGSNIGPNLTPYGSLATMLVLAEARRRGVYISFGAYLRVGLVTTPIVLLAATLVLVGLTGGR